jgi:phosphoglycolate phosphatase-like HAD superfamily hydrolase
MRFVFWDIDGTLLTTGRAGIFAWERAVLEEFGVPVNMAQMRTAGLTDTEIALTLSRNANPDATPAQAESALRCYEKHLPDCLPLRQGRVLPGVLAVLDWLRPLPDTRTLLLTGNTRAGAAAKLGYYGLEGYFADGAFADGCVDRVEIAKRALNFLPKDGAEEVSLFVIGDTPHDIRCGASIGARTIAVATGEYDLAQLASHAPWKALPVLPGPEEFQRLLQET